MNMSRNLTGDYQNFQQLKTYTSEYIFSRMLPIFGHIRYTFTLRLHHFMILIQVLSLDVLSVAFLMSLTLDPAQY